MARDLKGPGWIKLKAALFLVIVVIASGLLLLRTPELTSVLLLITTLWAACRAYYFAFYVLQHYVDPEFHYSGLGSLVLYLVRSRKRVSSRDQDKERQNGTDVSGQ